MRNFQITVRIKVEAMESSYSGDTLNEAKVIVTLPPTATDDQVNKAVNNAIDTLTDTAGDF